MSIDAGPRHPWMRGRRALVDTHRRRRETEIIAHNGVDPHRDPPAGRRAPTRPGAGGRGAGWAPDALVALSAGLWTSLLIFGAILLVAPGGGHPRWIDDWFYNLLMVGAAAVCGLRARRCGVERWAWLAFGATMLVECAAGLYEGLALGGDQQRASAGDTGFLLAQGLLIAAVALVVRGLVAGRSGRIWLDVTISGLGMSAVATTILRGLFSAGKDDPVTKVINLFYPATDVILALLLTAALTAVGTAALGAWAPTLAGLGVLGVTDAIYLMATVHGTYREGRLLDIGWPLAYALLASSGGRPRVASAPAAPGSRAILFPSVFALASLALLVSATTARLPVAAVALATAAVALALVRLVLAYREADLLLQERALARTDELTGLPNRRAFMERARAAIESRPASSPMAVLIVDLDGFKDVNDSLGHGLGDDLLRKLGPRITAAGAPEALVARLGGDEFAMLVEGDVATARATAERVRTAIGRPVRLAGIDAQVTGSVGVAIWPEHGGRLDELLAAADIAMYAAKATRAPVEVFDRLRDEPVRERFGLVHLLRDAIRSGSLRLHFQPQVYAADGTLAGFEALVRWHDPHFGEIPAGRLTRLAERSGLMGELTEAVLTAAVVEHSRWRSEGLAVRLAVNVSATNLADPRFPGQVTRILSRSGMRSEDLVLEITEDTLITNVSASIDNLAALRAHGVSIAIDDFGVGHSSLAYLHEIPADELKIDRSIVAGAADSERAAAILAATVSVARTLGMRTVAEGVEADDVRRNLRRLGCDLMQGDLVAPPMPATEVPAWIRGAGGVAARP